MDARLRLFEQEDGVENLAPTEEVEPSCPTCEARAAAAASPNPDRRRSSIFSRFASQQKVKDIQEKDEGNDFSRNKGFLGHISSYIQMLRKLLA